MAKCGMRNAECGVRNAEWTARASRRGARLRNRTVPFNSAFRIPHSAFSFTRGFPAMKLYDLSQPLNERSSFWPYYPPFEVKYIKRKAEHGVNAQYIMTSNHMGTHLDAPRHFVTAGKTIDELPLAWLCSPGVIVDLRDAIEAPELQNKRLIVGCFPWKFKGGEAAFARVVAFVGEWKI